MSEDTKEHVFKFNLEQVEKLRDAMNEDTHQSTNKKNNYGTKFSYFSWGRMCAAMDRIQNTLRYINDTPLCRSDSPLTFDFLEFLNNQYVVIEGIKTMAQIFGVEDDKIAAVKDLHSAFNKPTTDYIYFNYLRSLCSVHPVNTTFARGRDDFMGENDIHTCPMVIWDNKVHLYNDDRDLTVIVYNGNKDDMCFDLPLFVYTFEIHMNNWLNLIPEIISAIQQYNAGEYEKLRQQTVQSLSDFNGDIVEYLRYLKKENTRRFGETQEYIFDRYIDIFSVKLSNVANEELVDKYRNAIRLSLDFLHNQMQSMSFDGYENTGLAEIPANTEFDLFSALYNPTRYRNGKFNDCGSHLYELRYLDKEYSYSIFNKQYARSRLEEIKPIINEYVVFSNTESDLETTILIETALYLNALEGENILNQNIPNHTNYRIKVLSAEEYLQLLTPKEELPPAVEQALLPDEIMKIIKEITNNKK